MKINSSQVMFSNEHQKSVHEGYNRRETTSQNQTNVDIEDSPPGTRILKFNEVELSYQARMYSEQENTLNSFSKITKGDTSQTLESQRATHALTQTVVGVQAEVLNLSLSSGNQALIKPNSSRTYDQVAALNTQRTSENASSDSLQVTAGTASEQARVEIKEQYSLIENERLHVATQGRVTTEDGREIDFMMQLEMDRSFNLEQSLSVTSEERRLIDPLVINFDAPASSLTSTSFSFDLNADGTKEDISFTGQGSGFLALDANADGKINDGSELFGTGDVNGFAELAKYDNDDNKWIDENDEIFNKLKIWTRDENGEDQLISLKQAGVGAIYLGSTSASFDLTDAENNLLGQVKQSGVFLTEQGEVASIQELDIAIHNKQSTSVIDDSLANIDNQLSDWDEQAAQNANQIDVQQALADQSFTLDAGAPIAPIEDEEEKMPSLLDRLFPKPGSKYDTQDRPVNQRKTVQSTVSSQHESNKSGQLKDEQEESKEIFISDKHTIDVLGRLKQKNQSKLVEEQEQHAHLKAIIQSLVKSHQNNVEVERSDKADKKSAS